MRIEFSDVIGNGFCNAIKLIYHLNEKKIYAIKLDNFLSYVNDDY
jgi:hypothetical protein